MAKLEGMMPRSDRVITPIWMTARRHIKFGNMDAGLTRANRKSVTTRKLREPIDSRIKSSKSVAAEPNEAAAVAKIMQSMVKFTPVILFDYYLLYQRLTHYLLL